jgi:LuxR family transcriptional regulator, maltose regulon positive regulatory protein
MTFHAFDQTEQLAQTKFLVPVLRPDVVARPRLTQVLQQALGTDKVVLISAPAGYGKTTLLSTLPFVLPDLPTAWFSLDEGDNDPIQFVIGLVTALRQLNASVSQRLCTLLRTPFDLTNQHVERHKLIGLVINEVVEALPQPFVLVFDDLHRMHEPETSAALDYLIERLPPQMHLVIGTRYDPPLALARLRARGQLEELRTQDLCFTLSEVETFLNNSLKLDLPAQDVTFVHAQLEGWAAGLRLLASSFARLPQQVDRDSILRHLAGSERYIYDFLAEEILNQQEEATRRFLLETSILTELTPTLCQAVTGRQDTLTLLEKLYSRNLTMAVERRQHIYRYHDLFKEFLQQYFAQHWPQQFEEMHLRAAAAETVPSRSIYHYLEARRWEEAAVKMEQLGGTLLQEGLLLTVRDWITALPPAVRQQHPRLLYYLGICAWQRGETATVKELLQRAFAGFAASGDAEMQGESLLMLANACISHDPVQGQTYLEEALRFPMAPASRVLGLLTCVWQGFWQRNWEQAARDLDEAIARGVAEADLAVWNILGLQVRTRLVVLPDGLARLERFWHHRVARQFAEHNTVLRASLASLHAFSALMRGRLPEAVQANEHFLQGLEELEGAIWLIADGLIVALQLALACDDSRSLDRFVKLVHRFGSHPFFKTYQLLLWYLESRARWHQGRSEEVQQLSQAFPGSESSVDAQFLRLHLQALVEIAHQRYHQAESTLKAAKALAPQGVLGSSIADVAPILAYLYWRWGKPHKALAELEPLLAICEAEHTPGLLLQEGAILSPVLEFAVKKGCHADFAAALLQKTGQEVIPPAKVGGPSGPLSLREAEVLQFLAEGLSNREIADRLIISELTVKSHVKHLFQKLGVFSRTAAVFRARQLGLLP